MRPPHDSTDIDVLAADPEVDREVDLEVDGEVDAGLPGDDIEILDEPLVVLAEPAVDHHDDVDHDDVDVDGDDDGAVPGPARARTPIDPRIRARRIAVAREQGRRRLRVVVVALSLFVAVGSAWLLVESPFLDVDHIVVTGIPSERVDAVVAAAGVHRKDPLLLVSPSAVERRVEAVPGISSVRVTRELPGTLRIRAVEQGAALWARVPAGGVALIGFDGRVLRDAPVPPAKAVELRGLATVPAPGGRVPVPGVGDVMAKLPSRLRARVAGIGAANASDVRLFLTAGGEVRLGDLTSLHDKGVVALAVIMREGCPLSYVDVHSISNPVALPAPGATCNP